MAQDFADLAASEGYAALLARISDRDVALALGFDPAFTSSTNFKTRTIRWNSANKFWEYYTGAVWSPLESTYSITVSKAVNVVGGAAGSLVYQTAADTSALLGLGTAGYLLAVVGSAPAWVNPSSITVGSATSAGSATTAGTATDSTQLGGVAAASYAQTANIVGKQSVWIPAGSITPRITNGPSIGLIETSTYKIIHSTLDFDQSTVEYAQFQVRMPKSWNESTITAVFDWSSAIAGTGKVVWKLRAVAISHDDPIDPAITSATSVTHDSGTGQAQTASGDLMKTGETTAMTVYGTPVEGDMVVFEVYRQADDATNDTLAGDARLHGLTLFYTTNALNDA